MSSTTEPGSGFLMLVLRVLLAVALIGALLFAGWRIYRRLPAESPNQTVFADGRTRQALRLVVRNKIAGLLYVRRSSSFISIWPPRVVNTKRRPGWLDSSMTFSCAACTMSRR